MTLPKATTKLTVDFNRFDAMSFPANTNELEDVPADAPGGHVLNEQQQQQRPPPLVLNAPFLNDDAAAAASTATSRALINTNTAVAGAATITSTSTSTATIPSPATVVGITTTTASSPCSKLDFAVENVMPGIYLSKNFIVWNEENLHAHGFTHIIVIDRHIQELYYPSPIFKICAQSNHNTVHDPYEDPAAYGDHYYTQPKLNFSKKFEAIDLNFGEKSYLTTVLPNCYKAVRFLNKALLAGGTILVIDCNGGEQKCITIIVAYLMYKHNISFSAAFARLKTYYKKADLDRFFVSQLYEYEPILQVQRAQSRGHSCSREMHAAIFKRKKDDNDEPIISSNNYANIPSTITAAATKATQHDTNLFLGSFNPLAQFNTNTTELKLTNAEHRIRMVGEQEELQLKSNEKQNHSIYNTTFHLSPNPYTSHQLHLNHQVNAAIGNCNTSSFMSINNSNWDENAMEQC